MLQQAVTKVVTLLFAQEAYLEINHHAFISRRHWDHNKWYELTKRMAFIVYEAVYNETY